MTEREAPSPEFVAAYMEACKNRSADWNEIGYWYARQCWDASRKQALEEAARECDGLRDDAKEVEALAKFKGASASGNTRDELDRGEFWLTVSTFNAGLKRAAAAIRSLSQPTGGKE